MTQGEGAINPPELAPPKGYSYAYRSAGAVTVHFAGHTAMNEQGEVEPADDLVGQFERVLENLERTARAAEVPLAEIGKLTIYVTDVARYQAESERIGRAYRRAFGRHYPAITLVEISRLWDPNALIEIDAVAVL